MLRTIPHQHTDSADPGQGPDLHAARCHPTPIIPAGCNWLISGKHLCYAKLRAAVKKATSCLQLCTPTVQATMGPGVQAEVSLSVDPRVLWWLVNSEIHWPDGHPMLGFQSMPEHALSSPPLAYISLGHLWPVVGQKKLEKVIIKDCSTSLSETFTFIIAVRR